MTQSPTLPKTHLGTGGPLVGIQGLACMGMVTDYYGATDENEARATLNRALDLGVTLFDTADVYGQGQERDVHRALHPRQPG